MKLFTRAMNEVIGKIIDKKAKVSLITILGFT
jgi:hypothetical protein